MRLPRLPLWLFLVLMAGLVAADLAWFGPWLRPWLAQRRLLADVAAADALYEAMETALHDHDGAKAVPASPGVPWPAESGLRTTGQYLDRLAALHYLTGAERGACRDLVVANVGPKDASDTLLFASRNVYGRLVLHRAGRADERYVLYRKSGEGDVALEIPRRENLPPRTPAFLAP